MDEAHKARKAELEAKDNLDENEKVELENIKKHEAEVSGETGDDASANAGQANKSKSEQRRENAQRSNK